MAASAAPVGASITFLALATGARGVLVLTGQGRRTAATLAPGTPVAHVAANFRAAAEWIIDNARRKPRRRR